MSSPLRHDPSQRIISYRLDTLGMTHQLKKPEGLALPAFYSGRRVGVSDVLRSI